MKFRKSEIHVYKFYYQINSRYSEKLAVHNDFGNFSEYAFYQEHIHVHA